MNDDGGALVARDVSLAVDDEGDNPAPVAGSESATMVVVDPGAYSVSEVAVPAGYEASYGAGC